MPRHEDFLAQYCPAQKPADGGNPVSEHGFPCRRGRRRFGGVDRGLCICAARFATASSKSRWSRPPQLSRPRVRWTLPSQRGMHAMLGINEAEFMAATGATYRLASEHRGWQGEGSRFMHAHGELGSDLSGTPFYKYLLNEAIEGRAVSGDDFSVATLAARQGRFARPMGEGDALTASFTYGFHLDEAAYAEFLRQHAAKLGIKSAGGTLVDVELEGSGDIAALRLANGQRLGADLYVDCSGPQAAVIGRLAADDRDDWTSWLPCDRMLSGVMPAHPSAPALTQTTATAAGWLWRAPTAAHTHAGYVYCSRFLDDDSARRALSAALSAISDLRVETLRSGRRLNPWVRNCVAIGGAAIELEPLVGADLHAAQLGISALIELFPAGAVSAVEAAEYNRIMAEYGDGLRDFTLAHYRLGAARAGAFWDAVARSAAASASRAQDRSVQRERPHPHVRLRVVRGNRLGLAVRGRSRWCRARSSCRSMHGSRRSGQSRWRRCVSTYNGWCSRCLRTWNSYADPVHDPCKRNQVCTACSRW